MKSTRPILAALAIMGSSTQCSASSSEVELLRDLGLANETAVENSNIGSRRDEASTGEVARTGSTEFQTWRESYIRKAFEWHHWSTCIVFCVVHVVVGLGVWASILQIVRNPSSAKESEFSLSKDGIRVRSSVIGVIVLTISLGFFFLYLKFVYPIESL